MTPLAELPLPWLLAALGAAVLAALLLAVSAWRQRHAAARAEAEVARMRGELDQARLATVRAEEAARATGELLKRTGDELAQTRAALDSERMQRTGAERELAALQREHAARLEELRDMKLQLESRFAELAGSVLERNADAFLKLASERFSRHQQTANEELERRRKAIEALVTPLGEKLSVFDRRIEEIEKARNEAYGAIREQVRQLASGQQNLEQETRRLVQALRAPKTRGRWGEMQLRRVFEMAGMTENVDYTLEHSLETEAGRRRPDAVVRIPGGKTIVIDAKTPLEAYLAAMEADTPEHRETALKSHAAQVRAHVRSLASKDYQGALDTAPDFVVMFIPGESFVAAAAESDPGLIEFAFENRVLIATPTTLIALIKAIAYGWQQEKMARNAQEVQKGARELYTRLRIFAEHLAGLGKSLNSAVERYNKAVGSLESRVLPAARRFEALGVVTTEDGLAAPEQVTTEARALAAPELASPRLAGPEEEASPADTTAPQK